MAGADLKRRIENMKKANRRAGLPARILLSSIAVLTVLFYITAAPLQKNAAQSIASNLAIENSEKSPLQIVSAVAANISAPLVPTRDIAAHLIKPQIVLKNNSDRPVSTYVLEFKKAGSAPFYLARTDAVLAPKATESIQANTQNTFLYLAESGKSGGTGGTWTVRIDVLRFKDGSVLTLHSSPIPPPSAASPSGNLVGGIPGGVVGGIISQKGPVPPPPPPPPPRPVRKSAVLNGSEVQGAKLIRRVKPVYPELAKRARVQGQVTLTVTIDEEGNVIEAKILKGHPLLNDAAIAAVKQCKYSPTFLNGKPVPVATTVKVEFKLE
jgi:protein TonB